MDVQPEALTAEDVAHMLQLNKNTVYSLAKTGDLVSYKIGRKLRFTLDDVQTYISSQAGSSRANSSLASSSDWRPFAPHEDAFHLGGTDMVLDILANYLSAVGTPVKRSYQNCYQTLVELYFGHLDATVISLWDSSNNSYNPPYIKRLA